jgi:hypothetical protein
VAILDIIMEPPIWKYLPWKICLKDKNNINSIKIYQGKRSIAMVRAIPIDAPEKIGSIPFFCSQHVDSKYGEGQ